MRWAGGHGHVAARGEHRRQRAYAYARGVCLREGDAVRHAEHNLRRREDDAVVDDMAADYLAVLVPEGYVHVAPAVRAVDGRHQGQDLHPLVCPRQGADEPRARSQMRRSQRGRAVPRRSL